MKTDDINIDKIIEEYKNGDTATFLEGSRVICEKIHGKKVLLRGLLEYSNHCVQECLYCGIRKSNGKVTRYRLTDDVILEAVAKGYKKGLRTFVLQGGEDPEFSVTRLCGLVDKIKNATFGEAAITLSSGIFSKNHFRELKKAGADRYLIRFETSDPKLHKYLRNGVTLERRLKALYDLKELDYDLGSGYMVGLPGETEETRINNALLCRELEVDMAGIGPFIPHEDTPLKDSPQQPLEPAIKDVALLRYLVPGCHIPATTAAGTMAPDGRERMIRAGANVLMPNITPVEVKQHYLLYPGKICIDETGFQCIGCLGRRVEPLDRELSFHRGDAVRRGVRS